MIWEGRNSMKGRQKNGKFKMFSSKQMWRLQETIRMKCVYSFRIFDFDCWWQTKIFQQPNKNKESDGEDDDEEAEKNRQHCFLSVEPYFWCFFFSYFRFYTVQIRQFNHQAVVVDVLIVVTVLKSMLHKRIFSNDCVLCKYLFSTAPNRILMC